MTCCMIDLSVGSEPFMYSAVFWQSQKLSYKGMLEVAHAMEAAKRNTQELQAKKVVLTACMP